MCGPGTRFGKKFDFKIKGIMEKNSFERCVYKSVDDKSLPWNISQK